MGISLPVSGGHRGREIKSFTFHLLRSSSLPRNIKIWPTWMGIWSLVNKPLSSSVSLPSRATMNPNGVSATGPPMGWFQLFFTVRHKSIQGFPLAKVLPLALQGSCHRALVTGTLCAPHSAFGSAAPAATKLSTLLKNHVHVRVKEPMLLSRNYRFFFRIQLRPLHYSCWINQKCRCQRSANSVNGLACPSGLPVPSLPPQTKVH